MNRQSPPRLQPGEILDEHQARSHLDYCLQGSLSFRRQWRRLVWTRSAIDLLCPLTQFANKRILEVGVGNGRMSCLFAAVGADVTGVEIKDVDEASREASQWGCESRTCFTRYDGDLYKLPDGPYDVIFTKSVMSFSDMRRYGDFLESIRQRLAPDGAGYFLENVSNRLLYALRRYVTYRHSRWDLHEFGLTRSRVARFSDVFKYVEVRKHFGLVWTIRVSDGPRQTCTGCHSIGRIDRAHRSG